MVIFKNFNLFFIFGTFSNIAFLINQLFFLRIKFSISNLKKKKGEITLLLGVYKSFFKHLKINSNKN